MATAEQLIALINSIGEGDRTRFYRVALQVAAKEARKGHRNVAQELREAIDKARANEKVVSRPKGPVPIAQPRGDLEGLLTASFPETSLRQMVLAEPVETSLRRLLAEHRQAHRLYEHGLSPRRKLLLVGPPGTGKTFTSQAIAGELKLPLFKVRLEGLITRFMGETAAKLRLVFDAMHEQKGVYLFDEFDSIGADRGTPNDVGEIRRVLSSFLQFIEADESESLIVAATNHMKILDSALFRRFDDVIRYELPDEARRAEAFEEFLATFTKEKVDWTNIASAAEGLSYADIRRACEDAAKDVILGGGDLIAESHILNAIKERQRANFRSELDS